MAEGEVRMHHFNSGTGPQESNTSRGSNGIVDVNVKDYIPHGIDYERDVVELGARVAGELNFETRQGAQRSFMVRAYTRARF